MALKQIAALLIAVLLFCSALAQQRDPTRPANLNLPVTTELGLNGIQVTSILSSGARQLAIVNGKYLSPGESVANATLLSISDGKVHFKDQNTGKTFTVSVFNDSIKEPVRAKE